MDYKLGDCFTVEKFYVSDAEKGICIHALSSMLTLLSPLLKGVSAKVLGIGEQDDVGYVQCPDPGRPLTCGMVLPEYLLVALPRYPRDYFLPYVTPRCKVLGYV
ncbi:hypothetical protein Tagg_0566 [Thermosphaera aggregans DSM 11486]|uniref:TIGR04076 family protein n=1 Tax=Thermosphaera aggregans (strain DSM 11486 / M11TL) TaxID=633148 RepID=D5U140_THEAM|nr:hypothetical protein Tagg_0566 [Thermosphaera aggregans DSM 11486]